MDYWAACLCLEELPPFANKGTTRLSSDNRETAGAGLSSDDGETADLVSHSSLGIDELSSENKGTAKQSHGDTESACAVDMEESGKGGTSDALSLWFKDWGQKRKKSSNTDTGLSEDQYLEIVGR